MRSRVRTGLPQRLVDPVEHVVPAQVVAHRFDALAHLVGGWTGGMLVGRSPDEPYQDMIDQHFWTSLNVTRELAPRMAEASFGRIVAVSSPMAVISSLVRR